nr:MAG TPA: hypothetical protein [Caudoviricetes sp.]
MITFQLLFLTAHSASCERPFFYYHINKLSL